VILANVIRSGLVESTHEGAIAAVDTSGTILFSGGDIDRVFFLRSAAKPIQATVCQGHGADLVPEQLAVACGSHRGQPVHVALVQSMLEQVGLNESALQCPPSWPAAPAALRRVVAQGYQERRRIWHNCSGKHAAMLRACVAQGWPVDTYLDPGHPLQRAIFDAVGELSGFDPGPVGVDGCGAPVFRGTVRSLATAFARLAGARFEEAWTAMHRYPALTCDQRQPPAELATALNAVAKYGAEGSLAVSLPDGIGLAVKAWDGSPRSTGPAMVEALRRIGRLGYEAQVDAVARPAVYGGVRKVGEVRENSF